MSEKHIVVQGALCKCQHGFAPDKLKVSSHTNEYANDKDGSQKLIATTLEIGQPFEAKTFGQCKLQPMGSSYKPCQPMITEWQGAYEDAILKNGGNILIEDSKATCAIAGSPCVEITNHGQIAEPGQQNMSNADEDTQAQLNPMVNTNDMSTTAPADSGIIESVK
ncbi:DUF4280 domain-containing protein [Aquimarina longa]|uniref:DUF4280 domain-containing protein n=1 Tax=Aquimarina longa TaxID=1080221 RepID=UPI000782358C|nr:DUF4280 domain-containing protein [Aquimarina longa]